MGTPLTYYITDRRNCSVPLLEQIEAAVRSDVDIIQIREKDLATQCLLSLAVRARAIAKGTHTKILINDRLDVALAADLHGIHIGRHSVPLAAVRSEVGPEFLIGFSGHSRLEINSAEKDGADFATMGPVYSTPSKMGMGSPAGIEELRAVCEHTRIPVFALGGIDRHNFRPCIESGAAGIAAIRLFQTEAESLKDIVSRIHSSGSAK